MNAQPAHAAVGKDVESHVRDRPDRSRAHREQLTIVRTQLGLRDELFPGARCLQRVEALVGLVAYVLGFTQ